MDIMISIQALAHFPAPTGAGRFFPAGPAPQICLSEPAVAPVSGKKSDLRHLLSDLRHQHLPSTESPPSGYRMSR